MLTFIPFLTAPTKGPKQPNPTPREIEKDQQFQSWGTLANNNGRRRRRAWLCFPLLLGLPHLGVCNLFVIKRGKTRLIFQLVSGVRRKKTLTDMYSSISWKVKTTNARWKSDLLNERRNGKVLFLPSNGGKSSRLSSLTYRAWAHVAQLGTSLAFFGMVQSNWLGIPFWVIHLVGFLFRRWKKKMK